MMERLIHRLSQISANVATFALFLIMGTATLDVVSRNLLARSVPGIIESAEVILVIGAFLGLAYAQRTRTHVSTTFIIKLMPRALARIVKAAGLAVLALYVGFAAAVSAGRAWSSFVGGEVRFGLIEIPQWPARLAIALGFGLLLLEIVRDLWRVVAGRDRGHAGKRSMGGL